MYEFFRILAAFFRSIFSVLNTTFIPLYPFTDVSLGSILFVCLVIGFTVSIFWKGAKS